MPGEFKQEQLTTMQILSRHEMRLYNLERLYTSVKSNKTEDDEEVYATKKDLEMLTIENSFSSNNAKLSNDLENNKSEISTLITNIPSFSMSVSEMNSIIQGLKATIITQENEIKELQK